MRLLRPYIAIVIDSFRAATATRILYVMLAAITIVLLFFAPFRVNRTTYWRITSEDLIANQPALHAELVEKSSDSDRPDINRIWEALPAELQNELKSSSEKYQQEKSKNEDLDRRGFANRDFELAERLADALTDVVEDEDFYDEDAWKNRVKVDELNKLINKGPNGRTNLETKRMNRLLIESSFGSIRYSQPTSIEFSYFIWPFPDMNLSADLFEATVADWLPYIFDKFVLSIGLFVAILVTSNLIPETFNPGTLNLLLSKPIYRWALLVSKFIGGCAFITLCSVYLFVGLWLILGIQWGIWETSILLSILLYMVVFAIYYSVSVFIGIVFRSSIVSVICTAIFWGICFSVGLVYQVFEAGLERNEITSTIVAGDRVYHIDRFQTLHSWNADESKWVRHLPPGEGNEELGVLYVFGYMTPIFGSEGIDQFGNAVSADYASEFDAVLTSEFKPAPQIAIENPKMYAMNSDRSLQLLGTFPPRTIGIVREHKNNTLVAYTRDGKFFRLTKNPFEPTENGAEKDVAANDAQSQDQNADTVTSEQPTEREYQEQDEEQIAKEKMKALLKKQFFTPAGPDNSTPIQSQNAVAINASNFELVAYQQGKLAVYKLNEDGQYQFDRQMDLNLGSKKQFKHWIAYQGDYIVVVLGDGEVIVVNSKTMSDDKSFRLEPRVGVESLSASFDGRWFAVTYQNGNVWVLDTDDASLEMQKPSRLMQGYCTSAIFDDQNRLCVGEEYDQVTIFEPSDWSVVREIRPTGSTQKALLSYIIRPVYTICPKPGEFYELVTYLSLADKSAEQQEIDWSTRPAEKNPWSPLINGLIFMAFMLALSCLWFQRTDY
jgi:hypothetical protein